ncbi:thiamine phosphate synthase [Oscillospiraceae bacterium LTW-04]|nr:thiamine phosphate synthase [Oscillospiraceae bacterium MB24-C1]
MKIDKSTMLLYAVTDRTWLNGATLESVVEKVLAAGATFLQLREKGLSDDAFLAEANKMKPLAQKYNVPFVINDNIEVAVKCGANGVHVGQSDIVGRDVRALVGPDMILGISANTVETAKRAEESGADYIGVGAVFGTATKKDAQAISVERLREICAAVSIPVVAIGGINEHNILQLAGSGIDGVAVISAIFAKPDVATATRELRKLSEKVVNG